MTPHKWVLVPEAITVDMQNAAEKAETHHVIADFLCGGNDPQLGWGTAYTAMIQARPRLTEAEAREMYMMNTTINIKFRPIDIYLAALRDIGALEKE